jgi:hypothetical protein
MRQPLWLVPVVMLIGAPAPAGWAQQRDTLSADETTAVGGGSSVMRRWAVEGAPWPRVRIYRFIDATPEQSAAMFADYEHQKDYITDLLESTIASRPDPTRAEVSFLYKSGVPIFGDDVRYSVLDELRRDPDGSYMIEWHLVKGEKLRSVNGGARFTDWRNPVTGREGTLLAYDQFVVPNVRGAGLFFVRRRALSDMRDAVDAIAAQVERERASDRAKLDRQVAALRAALGQ